MTLIRVAVLALATCSLGAVLSPALADQQQSATESDAVRMSGYVTAEDGTPIGSARIHLVGKHSLFGSLRHSCPGSLSVSTTADGVFNAEFPRSDPRFRQNNSLLIVIEAANKRTRYIDWTHLRSYANQPLNIELREQAALPIQIIDSSGIPLENVKVSPAQVATHELPYDAWPGNDSTSDRSGVASIPGVSASNLRMVYAASESIGNQCLDVDLTADGTLQAVAMASTLESGRLRLPDGEVPADVEGAKLILTALAGETKVSPFSWCRTEINPGGSFDNCRLAGGKLQFGGEFPRDFPYVLNSSAAFGSSRPSTGQPIEIPLDRGTRVIGKLISSDTGDPIPSIYILHHGRGGRPTFSDEDGVFQFWAGRQRIGYYPSDVFEQFKLAGAFFLYPQKLPQDGRLELDPVQLQPRSMATGIVVDEAGNPVAGATITCTYKRERFSYNQTYYTDNAGKFHFHGISDLTGVSLTAQSKTRISESAVSLALAADSKPTIVISPRHAVRLRGRVVDYGGRPVKGASIRIRYSKTTVKESYSGRRGHMTDVMLEGIPTETDSHGAFVSPPILDWDRTVSIAIDAPGQRPFRTYLTDLTAAGNAEQDVDFGVLTMRPRDAKVETTIRVVDESSGQVIEGSKVVVLGVRTPRTAAVTDQSGTVTVTISDGPQLLGVQADGYIPAIEVLLAADSIDTVRLRRRGEELPKRAPVTHSQSELKMFARQLFSQLPPIAENASFHAKRNQMFCLAYTDFDAAFDQLRSHSDENTAETVGPFVAGLKWLDAKQLDAVMPYIDTRSRVYNLLRIAEKATNVEQRDELLGEAIVIVRELSGDDHVYTIAQIAEALLNIGESELAAELMNEAWQEHGELARVLEAGERVKKPGIARVFAPPYSLVDPDAALKLIELTAFAAEIERLQTKSLVYLALFAPNEFRRQCDLREVQKLSSLGVNQFYGRLKVQNMERGLNIAKLIPASPGKAQFLFDLLRNGKDATPQQRNEVARLMLESMLKRTSEASMVNTSELAAKAAVVVAKWDRELAEEFVFASLWLCENERTILPFNLTSRLACELAYYDHKLARVLVDPVFDDWSWLFDSRDASVIFTNNVPLAAAATIDPEWALELTEQLFDKHLERYPSRQYETAYGIVDQWSKLPAP